MSKWLRRGFGQNNSNSNNDDRQQVQSEPFNPPRNDMPPAASATGYHSQQQQAPPTHDMVGYASQPPPPATVAMDLDNAPQSRAKYSQQYEASRSDRRMMEDGQRQHRSSGHSSRERRPRSQYQQPDPYSARQGSAPTTAIQPPEGHFGPPPTQYHGHKAQLGNTTPPDVQPSFPPPAVTADSPQPSEAAQRRPAYLLHRDLVIGKGSYGQVCIASRGEPEGHSSSRSGKRKKFACKCVMLRNDPKYIAKLQEEVNVLRELRGHNNVIELFDVFCVDNELFIITELGRGGDLFHLLTTHPKHGVTEAYAGTLPFDCCSRRYALLSILFTVYMFLTFLSLRFSNYSQDGCRNAFLCCLSSLSQHLPS